MGKRNARRRFDEPRYGVSQIMVEAEARELKPELDSYVVQSLTDLKERSAERLRLYREADATLRGAVGRLPERERLAVTCMLGRDLHLVLAVYLRYLTSEESLIPAQLAPAEPVPLPFSEWLFTG